MSPRRSRAPAAAPPKRPAAPPRRQPAAGDPAPVFAALGHATRLRLVAALCAGGALSIARLTAGTAVTRQAVTKHLQVLADAGLVHDLRRGRERLWQVESARLEAARVALDRIVAQWDRALARGKTTLEREGPR